MYLRMKGTVLISTLVILSLMLMLGNFLFNMMKNNKELEVLYKFDTDIYDLSSEEEKVLNQFMHELNKTNDDSNNENADRKDCFDEDFKKNIEGNTLEYKKDRNKLYLITNKESNMTRKREIKYKEKNKKIILIPTYKFENNQNEDIDNS